MILVCGNIHKQDTKHISIKEYINKTKYIKFKNYFFIEIKALLKTGEDSHHI